MAFKKFAMVVLAGTALAMDSMGMPGDNAETGSGPETQASVLPTAVESAATLATEAAQSTPADTLSPFTNSYTSSFFPTNELSVPAGADGMATTAVDSMSTIDATATADDMTTMDTTATADDMTTMSTSVLTGDSMPLGTAGTGSIPHGNNASSTGSVPVSGSDGAIGVSIVLIIASTMLGSLFML